MMNPVSCLLIRVVKPFGYYVEHEVGETFNMPLLHVTELIQQGLIEIVVNNKGHNLNYDEPDTDSFTEVKIPEVEAPDNG